MNQNEGAAIVLYTSEGRILLQQRSANASRNPNKWGCFGGKIEEGESPLQAVKRECMEELAYALTNPRQFLQKTFPEDDLQRTVHYFTEKYDSSRSLTLNEGQGSGWFTIKEALNLDVTKTVALMLQKVKEQESPFI